MIKALYSGEFSIRPVGRVGSYAAAVQAKRCRARKYWVIQEFENVNQFGKPNFFHDREDLGKFKTLTAAGQFLIETTNDQPRTITGYAGTYVRINIIQ
jgi:hypothetical protein